jgi:hypothetical protein
MHNNGIHLLLSPRNGGKAWEGKIREIIVRDIQKHKDVVD